MLYMQRKENDAGRFPQGWGNGSGPQMCEGGLRIMKYANFEDAKARREALSAVTYFVDVNSVTLLKQFADAGSR